MSGAAGLRPERGCAGFPAGRVKPKGGRLHSGLPSASVPALGGSVARCLRSPLCSPGPGAASSACHRPPPSTVHSHWARPLRSPRASSRSAALQLGCCPAGELPRERQGSSGRIINHPQCLVICASSCTISGSPAPRGSEGKWRQRGNNPETFLLDCAQVREGSSLGASLLDTSGFSEAYPKPIPI